MVKLFSLVRLHVNVLLCSTILQGSHGRGTTRTESPTPSPVEGQPLPLQVMEPIQEKSLQQKQQEAQAANTLSGMTLGQMWDFVSNQDGTSPGGVCERKEYVDVIIIGAGMAGVSAAATLQAQDPDLTYVVLESQNRVGGRMRSVSFGDPSNSRTIEDGANWVLNFDDNPVLAMAQEQGLVNPVNDYNDVKAYYQNGTLVDPDLITQENERFMAAWTAAEAEADNQWSPDHEDFPDQGVVDLLAKNGWQIRPGEDGDLDYTTQWFYLDFEYAAADTSVRWFPYYMWVANHVNDMRGFEILPQTYYQQNANPASLRLQTRVDTIHYNENIPLDGKTYKVLDNANHTETGECADYYAQRVISTVSSGVITNNLIDFSPPLTYPHEQYNPFYMTQYVKIFYQFDAPFWDQNELIRVVRYEQHRGHCHHWANMNFPGFYEGSNMIRCEIMTEAFDELVDPVTQDLSQETLLQLLDPLRDVYGAENVGAPIDIYYPKLNKDPHFGYGAYANWKVGKTFSDFAKFFGGVEDVTPYCEHNGCNVLGEWTMILAGSATCYDHGEFTHGAFFSGEKSANIVLRELGYDVPNDVSPCDVDWRWLR